MLTEAQKALLEALKHLKIQDELIISIMLIIQEEEHTQEMINYLTPKLRAREEITAEEIFHKAVRIAQG